MTTVLKNIAALMLATSLITLSACTSNTSADGETNTNEWISLFNGRDLNDWQAKFTGYPLGENYNDTFRVEDGLLTVSYDNWDKFDGEFGHLFYKDSFSSYRLRAEYRFIGEQVTDGPGWAFRNNGFMVHSQAPASMALDQEFPVSLEIQILGGPGEGSRTTGNVCTPGMHVVINNELEKTHCINSSSKTFHGDQWVTLEVDVLGHDRIIHRINGEVVFDYKQPQLDESDVTAQPLLAAGAPLNVSEGYISIQAESHPTQFRKIELMPLN